MQKFILTGLFLSIVTFVFSQRPAGNGGSFGMGGQMPNGSIYGKVVDSVTGKGIDAASVQLIQTKMDSITKKPKQVIVGGMLTPANGNFRLENIPVMGPYRLQITGMGYRPYDVPFTFIDRAKMQKAAASKDMSSLLAALDKDLGNIKLGHDEKMLEGVTVTGSAPSMKLGVDRKIYNVENNLIASGGTATDVLRTVPSVSVDIDGNVSVRNSSPQIFVDGRPTTLSLDEIPADQIENVEVITNPSAKYDASGGTAGILNIVLKKSKRAGFSGNLRGGIDQRGKLNLGLNFNLRQGKFNFFGNGMFNQRKSLGTGTTERTSKSLDSTFKMTQIDQNTSDGSFKFFRGGIDYFLDNRNTITLSGVAMGGNFSNNGASTILSDTSTGGGARLQSKTLRETKSDFKMRNKGAGLAFVHNFPGSGHQLTTDLNYFKNSNENRSDVANSNFASGSNTQTGSFKQVQTGNGASDRFTGQIDYARPINGKYKFETGARLNQSGQSNENNLSFVTPSGTVILQPLLSTKFNYSDRVWAGYVNYTGKIGEKFGYQAGLRLESSDYTGKVTSTVGNNNTGFRDTVSNFSIKYPVSLFPSIFLSQQLNSSQTLQLNYSRRINRPGFFQLFPYITDYSDSLNISKGNANLKPEFTNSFELSYSNSFNKVNNLILSVYYKTTNNLITRYQTEEINPLSNRKAIISTFTNANKGMVGGFEAISKNKIAPWWDLTSNLNIYTSKITMDDPGITTVGQLWSWFGKLNNDFKLPYNFTAQVSAEYTSKRVLAPGGSASAGGGFGGGRGFMGGGGGGNAQGYSMPNYTVDASVKYEFLKNRAASITLSVRDIFKTDFSDVYTFTPLFDQRNTRRRDQQFFRLNFAYRFGKMDASLFKRKNMRNEQEGMQGGMEGMGGGQ